MNDNEIIKALECCKQGTAVDCKECPLYEDKGHTCITILSYKSLDLIKHQQAEIERLKAESDMADGYEDALVEMTKSEAIKEFWKRFDKVLCENIGPSKRAYWKISSDGNNLVKEMTEGGAE